MIGRLVCLFVGLGVLCSCASWREAGPKTGKGAEMGVEVTTSAFEEGGTIPSRYTCDGRNVSPPLAWRGIPEGTAAIALICDDPDAPMGTWVHWVVYDLPPSVNELPEGVPAREALAGGGRQGKNSSGKIGYTGPCPPGGTHRYYFYVYALDGEVRLDAGATKKELLKAMEGHILGQGQLMGRYERK